MKESNVNKLVLSALFLALGFVLPMITGQIPAIGKVLLPMHIPVLLCGFICGPLYGATIGFVLPLLRSLIFSVPVMYPTAIAVAFEMAVYGAIAGFLYGKSKTKSIISLYCCLIISMILGRMIRCIAELCLLCFFGNTFVFKTFFATVIVSSVPGIILQLIVIPIVMMALKKAKFITSKK